MDTKKEREEVKKASDFLDNLAEFYASFEDLSLEELKIELREDGIDPEDLLSKTKILVESKLKEAKLGWIKEAYRMRKSLLKQMELVGNYASKNIDEIKQEIKDMLSGTYGSKYQGSAQAFFRNLEEITDEDLRTLYEEFKKLELLESSTIDDKE